LTIKNYLLILFIIPIHIFASSNNLSLKNIDVKITESKYKEIFKETTKNKTDSTYVIYPNTTGNILSLEIKNQSTKFNILANGTVRLNYTGSDLTFTQSGISINSDFPQVEPVLPDTVFILPNFEFDVIEEPVQNQQVLEIVFTPSVGEVVTREIILEIVSPIKITSPKDGSFIDRDNDILIIIEETSEDKTRSEMQLYINDDLIETISSIPYNYSWGTSTLEDGEYIIKVIDNNEVKGTTTLDSVTVTLLNSNHKIIEPGKDEICNINTHRFLVYTIVNEDNLQANFPGFIDSVRITDEDGTDWYDQLTILGKEEKMHNINNKKNHSLPRKENVNGIKSSSKFINHGISMNKKVNNENKDDVNHGGVFPEDFLPAGKYKFYCGGFNEVEGEIETVSSPDSIEFIIPDWSIKLDNITPNPDYELYMPRVLYNRNSIINIDIKYHPLSPEFNIPINVEIYNLQTTELVATYEGLTKENPSYAWNPSSGVNTPGFYQIVLRESSGSEDMSIVQSEVVQLCFIYEAFNENITNNWEQNDVNASPSTNYWDTYYFPCHWEYYTTYTPVLGGIYDTADSLESTTLTFPDPVALNNVYPLVLSYIWGTPTLLAEDNINLYPSTPPSRLMGDYSIKFYTDDNLLINEALQPLHTNPNFVTMDEFGNIQVHQVSEVTHENCGNTPVHTTLRREYNLPDELYNSCNIEIKMEGLPEYFDEPDEYRWQAHIYDEIFLYYSWEYLPELVVLDIEEESAGNIVQTAKLYQNYPNPFNPETTIKFDLVKSDNVKLVVYNSKGQSVKTLIDKRLNKGLHQVKLYVNDLSNGVYFYSLITKNSVITKKMMLIK